MIDLGDTASKIKFGKNILGYSPQNEEGSNRGLRKIVAMNGLTESGDILQECSEGCIDGLFLCLWSCLLLISKFIFLLMLLFTS